ncbi:MAG TPA: hypothetical protein VGF38_09410 [Ktedonobacterales bacterium]|jgi:hypothetical protein
MKSWDNRNDLPDDLGDADDTGDAAAIAETSFPDPWDGDHSIEYWVWDGERLVPATPNQQAGIQEMERTASARRRLTRWHREHEQRRLTVRIRIYRGICQTIAGAWQLARHVTRPTASPLEADHAAISAQQQQDER